MHPRAREAPSNEDGFILIEVLVSALILAIVAGAVLTLLTATTRGAAAQRDTSVAYDIAQEDQARMRTLRIPGLNAINPAEPRTVIVGGTAYQVRSEANFVTSELNGTSCTEGSDSRDFIHLTSTVTGGTIKTPVVLESAVAPSNGSLDTAHGALIVQTLNAAGKPASGVTVTLPSVNKSATTETAGCANFPELALGAYTAELNGNGLITPEGRSTTSKTGTVVANAEEPGHVPTTYWDHPGTIEPEFVYLRPGSTSGELLKAPVDSMYVTNPTAVEAKVVGTPGTGTRSSVLAARSLYPFSGSKYTVYAGSCPTNNPGTANASGLYSGELAPGATVKPQIHVPALELTVTTGEGKEGKEGKELVVAGAKVTLTDLKCESGSAKVKRTYKTNTEGHLSTETAAKTFTGPTEAGVPFGTYAICASATINGEKRSAAISEQKVEDFSSKGTVVKMKLTTTGTEC
jgi:type II secretory pathway pseudopilin PulG